MLINFKQVVSPFGRVLRVLDFENFPVFPHIFRKFGLKKRSGLKLKKQLKNITDTRNINFFGYDLKSLKTLFLIILKKMLTKLVGIESPEPTFLGRKTDSIFAIYTHFLESKHAYYNMAATCKGPIFLLIKKQNN